MNVLEPQSHESASKLPHIQYPDERRYWNCPLMGLMKKQIHFSINRYDSLYIHAFKRIDEIWKRIMYDHGTLGIDAELQRMSLASLLSPIYTLFFDYLREHKPSVFIEHRNGYIPFPVEYHSLHEYLTQYGFNVSVARKYIEEDMSDPDKFNEIRREAESIYDNGYYSFGTPPFKIQSQNIVDIYPQSIERYRYLFSKPNTV
jgi:hypothetical protein